MRMIFIAIGAVIALGVGGAGAYFYFKTPAEASLTEDLDGHKEVAKDNAHDTHYEFVELDPLILPIVDRSGISQTVSLVIVLEVPNVEARSKVEAIAPRLKDAFIQDMYGALNRHAALKGGVLQVGVLKTRLNKISDKIAGEDTVHDVLLQVVQQRPL